MNSTVTNQGKARFMIIDDTFGSERLIEFLEALIKDIDRKIFLILDNLRAHISSQMRVARRSSPMAAPCCRSRTRT